MQKNYPGSNGTLTVTQKLTLDTPVSQSHTAKDETDEGCEANARVGEYVREAMPCPMVGRCFCDT